MQIDGARVLITGGGGGIGSAIAIELVEAGAHVLLADADGAALARVTAGPLAAHAARVDVLQADLTDRDGRARLCDTARRWRGGIDILVNGAGINHFCLYDDHTTAQIDLALAVNVAAPLHLVHDLLGHLRSRPRAAILNIGSVFGHIGYPGYALYSASKFALRGFSQALRRELAGSRVQVHDLAPRATRTPINPPAVVAMNAELGVTMDPPGVVARRARELLATDTVEGVIGWPEKFFARLNAVLPRLVDRALAKQLPVIRRHAHTAPSAPAATPSNPAASRTKP